VKCECEQLAMFKKCLHNIVISNPSMHMSQTYTEDIVKHYTADTFIGR